MSLTPYEFSFMMLEKQKSDFERLEFFRSEFRTANYFSVITSMNEFKGIQKPSDLYSIPSDDDEQQQTIDKPLSVDQDLIYWAQKELATNHD